MNGQVTPVPMLSSAEQIRQQQQAAQTLSKWGRSVLSIKEKKNVSETKQTQLTSSTSTAKHHDDDDNARCRPEPARPIRPDNLAAPADVDSPRPAASAGPVTLDSCPPCSPCSLPETPAVPVEVSAAMSTSLASSQPSTATNGVLDPAPSILAPETPVNHNPSASSASTNISNLLGPDSAQSDIRHSFDFFSDTENNISREFLRYGKVTALATAAAAHDQARDPAWPPATMQIGTSSHLLEPQRQQQQQMYAKHPQSKATAVSAMSNNSDEQQRHLLLQHQKQNHLQPWLYQTPNQTYFDARQVAQTQPARAGFHEEGDQVVGKTPVSRSNQDTRNTSTATEAAQLSSSQRTLTSQVSQGTDPSPNNSLPGFHLESALSERDRASAVQSTLVIHGELDTMTQNWTASELAHSYRLVAFDVVPDGPTVHVNFRPSSLTEFQQTRSARFLACLRDIDPSQRHEQPKFLFIFVDFIRLIGGLLGFELNGEGREKVRNACDNSTSMTKYYLCYPESKSRLLQLSEDALESRFFPPKYGQHRTLCSWSELRPRLQKAMRKFRYGQLGAALTSTELDTARQDTQRVFRTQEPSQISMPQTPNRQPSVWTVAATSDRSSPPYIPNRRNSETAPLAVAPNVRPLTNNAIGFGSKDIED